MVRCCYVIWGDQCPQMTWRIWVVAGEEGSWPTCHLHGMTVMRDLMARYPRRAIHSRRVDQ